MRFFRLLLFLLMATACTKHITRPSPDITFKGDYLLYKGERFTGIVDEHFQQAEIRRETHYRNGRIDGDQNEFYSNGQMAAHREYTVEKKTGAHKGWFPDGKRKFHYEYSDGVYDGESWEWYNSGGVSLYARFEKGRAIGKKQWREDGQIYSNFAFPEGKLFGLPGSKLCYQVRSEKK